MRSLSLTALILLAACGDPAADTAAEAPPGPLMAGFSQARIPAPVGIGTAGYGPASVDSESPYSEIYPATTTIHGHPAIKVTVLSRGEGHELVFISWGAVGVFQQLRIALVRELEERLGRPMDDVVIWGATHTHAGPGRVVDAGGPFDLIADKFFPEFYERMMDTLADQVEAAYADLQPARLGHTFAYAPDAHNDRRCEDGGEDYTNDAIPLIAVERDGVIDGLVMAYAIHGTVLDADALTLSGDVAGAIEEAVADRFDHPVQVSMFDSWGADVSPGSPEVEVHEGADLPDGYDRHEQVATDVAAQVHAVLGDIVFEDEPTLRASTYRVRIDRDHIGYDDDTFEYDYGGVYCGLTGDADCDAATIEETLDDVCVPFNEDYPAPNQTLFTVGQVGELYFTTFTGEPGTRLAEKVMDGMAAHESVTDTMFLGYTQDYLGYSILEDDWWQGGYEASGALWGPRQGEYLSNLAIDAFDHFMGTGAFPTQPAPVQPFAPSDYEPVSPPTALEPGTVLADVAGSYGVTEVVTFTVAGDDPWYGAPTAWLETAGGEPVLRPGGTPAQSDSYLFWVQLAVDPSWEEDGTSTERSYAWTFSMPVAHHYPISDLALSGDYRLRVELPRADGSVDEVVSGTFSVQ
jgi:hypothetical protein